MTFLNKGNKYRDVRDLVIDSVINRDPANHYIKYKFMKLIRDNKLGNIDLFDFNKILCGGYSRAAL